MNLQECIRELVVSIKSEENPLIISNEILYFLSHTLKDQSVTLYEAYALNAELLGFERKGYIQPAWNSKVRISICLSLLNQKLLAHFFDEQSNIELYQKWAVEAYGLNQERRPHYLFDRFLLFLDAAENPELLRELAVVRRDCENLSEDEGPYHFQSFPFHYYSPEDLLLNRNGSSAIAQDKTLSEEITNLVVELSVKA